MSAPPEDPPTHGARRGADALLAAAMVLGLVRFLGLGEFGLWFDEVLTWGDARSGTAPRNAAGYAVVGWVVDALGGEPTEAALRLGPAVAGWLAIPLTALAFAPLAGPRRAAAAALVVALSPWQLQWSQTARFYTFCEVATLLGAALIVRGALAGSLARFAAGIVVGLASALFHAHGVVVTGAVAACAMPMARANLSPRAWRTLLAVAGVGAVAAALFAGPMLRDYMAVKSVADPVSGAAHFARSTAWFVTPTVAAACIAAMVLGLERGGRGRALWCVVGVAVVGGVALTALGALVTTTAQYAFSLFPWIALLAVWPVGDGTDEGAPRGPRFAAAWLLVVALPLVAGQALYFTAEHGQRPRWREASEFVDARRAPNDVVAALPAAVVEFYLSGRQDGNARRHDLVVDIDRYRTSVAIEELPRRSRTVWYVIRRDYLERFDARDRAAIERFLAERCRRVQTFPVQATGRDLTIDVWRFDAP